ncbi:MAG TPA: hypothetical protein VFY40_09475, partial [Blastocatellia bacterium]|nr:hypothetical protein [Blastocatellia bacterium]
LGLPVTAWAFLALSRRRSKVVMAVVVLAIFAYHTRDQVAETVSCVIDESMRMDVGAYLKDAHKNDPGFRIYCDDSNVRFLSGLPHNKFLTASSLPSDPDAILRKFDEAGVKYVVCTNWEASTVTKLFPKLRKGEGDDVFHPVTHARSKHSGLEFWVYRFR